MASRPGSTKRPDTESYSARWLDQVGLRTPAADAAPAARGEGVSPLTIVALALIAFVLLGPIMSIEDTVQGGGAGNAVRQIGYLVILAGTIWAIRPTVTARTAMAVTWPVFVALAWCWISMSWALDPSVGVRRIFLTTLVAWMVFALVRHGGYERNINLLRYVLLASIVISYVVVATMPAVGIHLMRDSIMPTAVIGNWRGIFADKNFAGAVCALCILTFIFDAKQIRPAIRIGAIVIAAYFLFRAQSKTSAGMVVLATLGGVIFEFVSQKLRRYLIPLITIGGSALWFVSSFYKQAVETNFFNPRAFTGRGQIWSTLLRYVADHPITGAGFGSFWNIEQNSPVLEYGQGIVQHVTVGHSGYIDQMAAVGVPGVLLMVFALAVWPLTRLLASNRVAKGQGALISAMLIFCIGHNVTESGLFERDAIVSTMFFFAAAFAHYATLGDRSVSGRRQAGDDVVRQMRQRRRSHRPVVMPGD